MPIALRVLLLLRQRSQLSFYGQSSLEEPLIKESIIRKKENVWRNYIHKSLLCSFELELKEGSSCCSDGISFGRTGQDAQAVSAFHVRPMKSH
jgi:hypothetical protein